MAGLSRLVEEGFPQVSPARGYKAGAASKINHSWAASHLWLNIAMCSRTGLPSCQCVGTSWNRFFCTCQIKALTHGFGFMPISIFISQNMDVFEHSCLFNPLSGCPHNLYNNTCNYSQLPSVVTGRVFWPQLKFSSQIAGVHSNLRQNVYCRGSCPVFSFLATGEYPEQIQALIQTQIKRRHGKVLNPNGS